MKVKSLSHVQFLTTPWTVAHQAPPSMGFSRQEYWSGGRYLLCSYIRVDPKSRKSLCFKKLNFVQFEAETDDSDIINISDAGYVDPRPNGEGQEMHGKGIQNQNTEDRAMARLRQTLQWPLLEEMPLSWRECHS